MLLLPSLGSSRKRAVAAQCKNNLRQCGIAVQSYLGDNGGNIRTGYILPGEIYYTPVQVFALLDKGRYIQIGDSTRCPSLPPSNSWKGSGYGTRHFNASRNFASLGNNAWFMGCSWKDDPAEFNYPMMSANNAEFAEPILIHERSCDMLFTDGHVESLRSSGLKSIGFNNAWLGDEGPSALRQSF
ncbi:MAG: hypothetical protein RL095_3483 [Verrucomicrobiota bacterium]